MELPHIGQQCSESNCKQLDFLSLQCKCAKFFCSKHFKRHVQECPELQSNRDSILRRLHDLYGCAKINCKIKSVVPITCETCKQHFCIAHRHFADCLPNDAQFLAAETEKGARSVKLFNEAKAAVDKQIEQRLERAKKKTQSAGMASRLQLIKLKSRATGLKSIPASERIYFNVKHPKDDAAIPVFVCKLWTLGRTVDAVAEECKVQNNNNQSGVSKLKLFDEDGKMLSDDMSRRIDGLLGEKRLFDGQTLILQYV